MAKTKDKDIKAMENKPVEINVSISNVTEIALFSAVLNQCFVEYAKDPKWLGWVNSKNEYEVTMASTALCVPLLQTYSEALKLNKAAWEKELTEKKNGKSK